MSSISKDEFYMREALSEAKKALALGEVPIGCVVVLNDRIIGRGHNVRESEGDPTAHAEMVALRCAAKSIGDWRLDGATIYVTMEPCIMCTAAIIMARVERIVYATKNDKFGACGTVWNLPDDPAFGNHPVVKGGVLENEAKEILDIFFRKLRGED